ncbi:MAG: DNA replication and repair protein RecF [Bacillota bacterium]
MVLRKILLINFRNYAQAEFVPGHGINLLTGENAAGKTNIIEAVYFSLCGRSFRTNREEEIVYSGSDEAIVRSEVTKDGLDIETAVELGRNGKRLFINGKQEAQRGFPGNRCILLFRPEDMEMVSGNPVERRRFFDRFFSGVFPGYHNSLRKYLRFLEQRNSLLRNSTGADSEYEIWTESLVRSGSELCYNRLKAMAAVAPLASGFYREITGQKLALRYLSALGAGESKEYITGRFHEIISSLYEKEWRYRQTLTGPHRDDFTFVVKGKDLRTYGSRGEQRTVVLALKLAEAHMMKDKTGEQVIYLLDDVFSELDGARRAALLETVSHGQSFLTTVEPVGIDGARRYRVSAGVIEEAVD